MKEPHDTDKTTSRKRTVWPRAFVAAIVAVGIFQFGVLVGRGGLAPTNSSVSKNLPEDLNYSSVELVYDKIRQSYDGNLDHQKLLEGLKQGLAQATGDPYTEYFDEQAAKEFDEQLGGTFSGIGAELGKDEQGNVTVIAPLSGYPAEKAGLKAKDIIISVNDESTTGNAVGEVVSKIRGPVDTKVTLKVIRNKSQELTFDIVRAQIKIDSVKAEVLEGNIGYMKISRFGEDTVELARRAAADFKQQNVNGVILDLRDDPGGLLDAAVDVSSLWLDQSQTVLEEKRAGKVIKSFSGTGNNPILKGIPTVVLINEGSASASEIVAGALRDNKQATLVGVKTYGKGSVQQLERLSDGTMIKITIAHWFTPAGRNIDKQGIEPDKKVERTDDDITNNRDPQRDAALEYLKK